MPDRNKREGPGLKKQSKPEPWEVEAVHREFPTRAESELEPAIEQCKEQREEASRNRHKLAECVSEKIR